VSELHGKRFSVLQTSENNHRRPRTIFELPSHGIGTSKCIYSSPFIMRSSLDVRTRKVTAARATNFLGASLQAHATSWNPKRMLLSALSRVHSSSSTLAFLRISTNRETRRRCIVVLAFSSRAVVLENFPDDPGRTLTLAPGTTSFSSVLVSFRSTVFRRVYWSNHVADDEIQWSTTNSPRRSD